MKIIKEKDVDLSEVAGILKKGGLVIYPTETLYGIGVDATKESAVKKLGLYKRRPVGKPYSIAVSDINMAKEYVSLNKSAEKIYKTFLPGPVTVVSTGKHRVAKGVESESGTLGVRIPDYPLVTNIVRSFGKPITATSANASYKKRPYKISDILENISSKQKKLIDLVIDAGELPHNEPSTVVDTTYEDPTVLRQGEVLLKDKNEILSRSPEDTKNFAKEIWQKYEKFSGTRAIVFALTGEMGSGKTVFTKGLAKAMGIKDMVTSPSFNLVNKYNTNNPSNRLTHIDVWRMGNPDEIEDLNLDGEINDKSVMAIEWADKIQEKIRVFNEEAVVVWIKINFTKDERVNERIINWGVLR